MTAWTSEVVGKFLSTLPEDDDHPYRTGPWRPQTTEWDADDLTVVEGEIPRDLDGVYLRNTENPLHPAMKAYHPFDGDGMVHVVGFRDGKAFYRNRFVRTDGFAEENEAGGPLWPGLAEPVGLAKRDYGWGARTLMKDASSTDVIVHRGTALTSFYQCGDLYRVDPYSGDTLGKAGLGRRVPVRLGRVGAPEGRRPRPANCCSSTTASRRRTCTTASSTPNNELVHYVDVPLPGPRLPHDMAFTENYVDPQRLSAVLGSRAAWSATSTSPGFHRDMPSRFAVIPRRGGTAQIRWFEADPTYVLHFTNAYEDGDEIVLDGFFQGDPEPADNGSSATSGSGRSASWRWTACRPGCTAGGSTSSTGGRARRAIVGQHHRIRHDQLRLRRRRRTATPTPRPASRAGSCSTAWSSTICRPAPRSGSRSRTASTAARRRWRRASAARARTTATWSRITTDMNADASYCLVFDAARVADGPVCKLALPERVSSGTHSTWAPGSELRRWQRDRLRGRRRSGCRWTQPEPNAVGRMLGVLGDEWTLLIVQQALLGRDPVRRIRGAPADLECGADPPAGSR